MLSITRSPSILTPLCLLTMAVMTITSLSAADSPSPIDESAYSGTIRVACIGDSITAGAGASSPDKAYPVVLGHMLGSKYEVRNFGVSGRTLLSKGDEPYIKEDAWRQAQAFNPDIVTIKLGTNDSKAANGNYGHLSEMSSDLKAMIATLQALPSKPRIYLCLPAFVIDPGNYDIDEGRIVTGIIPVIRAVAAELSLPIIDLHATTKEAATADPSLIPDRVHPNDAGYRFIAGVIYTCFTGKQPPTDK